MDKIWLKAYPPYVPATIDPGKLRSLKQLLEETCTRHADRVAYIYMGTTITYGELDQLSRAFGAWLRTVERGEYHNIGLRRVSEIWMAGWDAAVRAREESQPGKRSDDR